MALPVEFLHGISREAINELAVRRYEGEVRLVATAGDLECGAADFAGADRLCRDRRLGLPRALPQVRGAAAPLVVRFLVRVFLAHAGVAARAVAGGHGARLARSSPS